ncbi:Predicted dehydrogenase [Caldanaerobius fijiensis DSM 17918]|uniref:Predicted dehydrogenase n=1 Tax=Caldanaerobius fijiensis DSM 17918 TaxID=1121256 RepID=A0A1M4SP70_9THEO|nr:Gfo/Idh/MocA family oxidoreductase [Caldanaerobius fijiensis]SHE33986.1 Predicted dehydrogenase [Caldanaerobius fijiensis DSM 17918]
MKKVRVGLVGCGGIAHYHVDHLLKMDDVDIVAVADPIEERREAMKKKVNAFRAYYSHKELYDAEDDLDAVYICIPPYAHTDTETRAIEKGFNIFVEKPMALSMEKANEVKEAIEKKGIISAVGFQDRYLDIIDKLKEYLRDREVGIVYGSWIGGIPGVPWWKKKEQSGGQIVEQNIHLFDMLRYLFGEVDSVYCSAKKGLVKDVPGYDVEDYSATTMTFKNGVVATLFTGCYLTGEAPDKGNGLRIMCRDARIEYDLRRAVRFMTRYSTIEYITRQDQGMIEDRAFIEAIKSNNPGLVRSPYADAVKSLQLTLAANKSIETGSVVVI